MQISIAAYMLVSALNFSEQHGIIWQLMTHAHTHTVPLSYMPLHMHYNDTLHCMYNNTITDKLIVQLYGSTTTGRSKQL